MGSDKIASTRENLAANNAKLAMDNARCLRLMFLRVDNFKDGNGGNNFKIQVWVVKFGAINTVNNRVINREIIEWE